ncbi:MAG: cbb3-type cytochrome oxidase assembly protein CcoS [Candidatus Marinimicrobia bacterium]|nr:cbb3-type cytochrome oxidase assembly protein CcoS [Candidatus Neomarinimicrobiota bacterium]
MSVMVLLVGFSIVVAAGFLLAFLWAVKSGQYDDRHTPAVRMLFDDKQPSKRHKSEKGLKNSRHVEVQDRAEGKPATESAAEEKREAEQRYGR